MPRVVSILEVDPNLAEDLSDEDLSTARRQLVADVKGYPRGAWIVGPDDFDAVASLGLLIVKGLLARQVTIGDHTSAELLGPGDVLQPWLRIGPDHSVAVEVGWEVIQAAQVAVLDRAFCARASRWPEITAAISRRLCSAATGWRSTSRSATCAASTTGSCWSSGTSPIGGAP